MVAPGARLHTHSASKELFRISAPVNDNVKWRHGRTSTHHADRARAAFAATA